MSGSDGFRDMLAQQYDFMKKGMFTDVSFRIGGAKIGAHKAVLASCSKVFLAMFETEMMESQTKEVEISDVNEKAFGVFLDYIYTRKDENIENHLDEIFMLADKYDIQPLVDTCEQFMKKSLNMDNAFDFLQISDLYRREDLKTSIIEFLKLNLNSASLSDKWEELKAGNPTLASALLLSLINDRYASMVDNGSSRKILSYREISSEFSDAVFKIDTVEFPVHKFILAERSGQLLALFEKDAKERKIEGVTVAEFEVLMDFVYLNKLPNAVNDGILKAALKFELHDLVDHCVSSLKQQIQLGNAIPTLISAKLLQLVSLKSAAMDFIVDHMDSMQFPDYWGDLKKYPDLLLEVYMKTTKSQLSDDEQW